VRTYSYRASSSPYRSAVSENLLSKRYVPLGRAQRRWSRKESLGLPQTLPVNELSSGECATDDNALHP
jgi:hypothetical protein